ncbi:rfaE bifunctional protein kinase chain/domain/rfaE bifunctional protein nucleotidyltransferase chain/domain [Motilibacter peucedani]|uniref:D-glycero-beta-D-manno-heptose 1-phosphate adenylyltransferase n=1 Tax=Motilibacter peucedani TaxID=598650 RepID=A0A420XTQ2_9ACTN|nr:D-glycero-beta-D-manno-heptose 1-phosphate adenylyltransferase [Motilibacter peucedani]RKS80215.1 rfaE bifunctional protein kinase chain/domain/rfaE bifunctional protein nucleotidyltransferase chain/domain [Motilibacter peucedani]
MTRLVVVGDALLDRDVVGTVERVAPDAPVPVVDVSAVHDRPGGAGLAALLAASPGVEVTLVTALGADAAGERLRTLLAPAVALHELALRVPTRSKTRVRVRGQSLLRLDSEGSVLDLEPSAAPAGPGALDPSALELLLASADAVLVADYGGPVTAAPGVRDALAAAARAVPVVWDPHPRGLEPVAGCAVVTPNRAEATLLGGAADDLAALGAALAARWSAGAVAVTDGARGVVLAKGAGATRHRAQPCPDSVDTCGAGDRFAAAVAAGLGTGLPLPAAVDAAVEEVAAWLAAGGVGALANPEPGAAPLLDDSPTAEDVVARTRARGGRVVATGGCFDLLHPGHLSLLQAARGLGDALVVLVNSDDSTRRLKGLERPVNPAADRVRMLEALACVDAAVVFEDDRPDATLERLRPDVWVKGGDYRLEDLPEARVVESYGGRVEIVPFVEGRSTTALLERLARPAVLSPNVSARPPWSGADGFGHSE